MWYRYLTKRFTFHFLAGWVHDLRQQDQLLQLQQGAGPAAADDRRRCPGGWSVLLNRNVDPQML